jgi:4-carboxymuconolactone decarboxylase
MLSSTALPFAVSISALTPSKGVNHGTGNEGGKTMKSLTEKETLLVALGAAIGSNCVPCVEKIVPKARAAGVLDWELGLALRTADHVRQKPAAKVLAVATGLAEGESAMVSEEAPCPLDEGGTAPVADAARTSKHMWKCCG